MHATQIYVASQTAHELIVVAPSYSLLGVTFTVAGLLVLLISLGALLYVRIALQRSFPLLLWVLPLVGLPFLIVGLNSMQTTTIVVSTDTGMMNVRKTILSIPVASEQYPLSQVREVRVGVADIGRFLYVSLVDGRSEDLLGSTDRTGYSEVADAMNSFLDANRR